MYAPARSSPVSASIFRIVIPGFVGLKNVSVAVLPGSSSID